MSLIIPEHIILETMQEVIDRYLIPKFNELGMNATGNWIESLEARAVDGNGEIWGMDYTYWLNNGRGKNKDQSEEGINHFTKWAGYYIFKPWAESKGILINPYAVARKIAKEGTEVRPERRDFLNILSSKEVIDYVNSQIGNYLSANVQIQIVRDLKEVFS